MPWCPQGSRAAARAQLGIRIIRYDVRIQGEHRLAAARQSVWLALNDTDVLRACIPGCQSLHRISDTVIEAVVAAQLGPVKAPFATRIELKDLDAPRAYTLVGEGKSAAGFGRGETRVTLEEIDGTTTLRYVAELKLGGKLAQVGARLLDGATRKLADEFFSQFAAYFPAAPPMEAAPEARPASRALIWWILLAFAAAAAAAWLAFRFR
jgi:carbon monoxide dehydrogenase subunit G